MKDGSEVSVVLMKLGNLMTSQEIINDAKRIGLRLFTKEEVEELLADQENCLAIDDKLPLESLPLETTSLSELVAKQEAEEGRRIIVVTEDHGTFAIQDGSLVGLRNGLNLPWKERYRFLFHR